MRCQQCLAQGAHQVQSAGTITVNADRVDAQSNLSSVHGEDLAFSDEPQDLRHSLAFIRDQGASVGAKRQRTVRLVSSIREGFARNWDSVFDSHCFEDAPGGCKQDKLRVQELDRFDNGLRETCIACGLVVEGTMEFNVAQGPAFFVNNGLQGASLSYNQLLDPCRGNRLLLPTETRGVDKGRVGSDGNSVIDRQNHGASHRLVVPRVSTARDVGRGYQGHQFAFGSDSFPKITVQVEGAHDASQGSPQYLDTNSVKVPLSRKVKLVGLPQVNLFERNAIALLQLGELAEFH